MKLILASLFAFLLSAMTASAMEAPDYDQVEEQCAALNWKYSEFNRSQWRQLAGPDFKDVKIKSGSQPRYPINSPWRKRVCVAIRYDVNEKGRTEQVEALEKIPEDAPYGFELRAIDAIEGWKYSPATRGGKPVRREGIVIVILYEVVN
ncbi:MAG: energy transducer TonB [Parvularculaceae bacterium]